MTSEKLHDALSLLPADLVAETDALRTKPKKHQVHWQRWAAMAACLAVVLLAGTMFSYFFGHMGSSKTTAAADKAPMSIAEAADQKNAAPNFDAIEEAAPADGGHTHAPADEPESANSTEDGYCGNTSATVTLDGSAYTLSGSDAVTLTAHSGKSGLYQRRYLQLFHGVHGGDRDRHRIRSEPDGILRPLRRRTGGADPKAGGRHPGDRRAAGRIIPKYFVLYV